MHPQRILALIAMGLLLGPLSASAAELFVNRDDRGCQGRSPCFLSIQRAIDRARSGDTVQIQPGVYLERLLIRQKNPGNGASEAGRIAIQRAPDAAPDSVILRGTRRGFTCESAIKIAESRFVTLRGLVISGFSGPAIALGGGARDNEGIRIEQNRIFDNGGADCGGGIAIGAGNPGTVVINNLIYANGGDGIDAGEEQSGRPASAAPRYLIQNTVHGNLGNGITLSRTGSAVLANNAVTGNGEWPRPVWWWSWWLNRLSRQSGYGVLRRGSPREQAGPPLRVLNNLICDNQTGELSGAVLGGDQADNRTPTGSEATGVLATPECQEPEGVYANLVGADGAPGTLDDDFTLAGPNDEGPPSPAIDRGYDLQELGLDTALDPLLLADYSASAVRPTQRDSNRPLDFDIGARELPCGCYADCESCRIKIETDGSSTDQCAATYSADQCCNRITGEVSEKYLGSAYDVCPATRSQRPGWYPGGSSDGCSAVPDNPFPLCPDVRFGCDEDSGVENCPEGIDLPCNHHDFCYQTCGVTRAECDEAFYDDMIRVCNNMTVGEKLVCYDNCVNRAAQYYDGVLAAGGSSYENGQNRACQCCQNVFPSGLELGASDAFRY